MGTILLGIVILLIATISAVAGYLARDRELAQSTRTLGDVIILARHSEHAYTLQTSHGQSFETTMCADSYVDWQPHEKLIFLTYEQRNGCKSISGHNLGFLAYTDTAGNRIKFPLMEEISDGTSR